MRVSGNDSFEIWPVKSLTVRVRVEMKAFEVSAEGTVACMRVCHMPLTTIEKVPL